MFHHCITRIQCPLLVNTNYPIIALRPVTSGVEVIRIWYIFGQSLYCLLVTTSENGWFGLWTKISPDASAGHRHPFPWQHALPKASCCGLHAPLSHATRSHANAIRLQILKKAFPILRGWWQKVREDVVKDNCWDYNWRVDNFTMIREWCNLKLRDKCERNSKIIEIKLVLFLLFESQDSI